MSKRPSFASVAALHRRPMMSDSNPEVATQMPEASSTREAPASAIPEPTPAAEAPAPSATSAVIPTSTAPSSRAATRTRPGVRGDQEDRRPIRRGKRALTFWVNPEPHKQFKMLSVREERPGQDLLEEALDDLFAKYGMHRITRQS